MQASDAGVPWSRVSAIVAETIGLHFPRERWADLQRGLTGAAAEFGFDDVAACAEWLLASSLDRAQLNVLASHLTIGETYFFRDKSTFAVLRDSVLPELIRARRSGAKRLRIWSAACCSGEEAYSLAILLRQVLGNAPDWRATILATDINTRFLRKAIAGSYGEWSFRDAPDGFKARYFNRTPEGRYVVLPAIRDMVTFAPMNLVDDAYPSLATDTNAMDLILCRNVLMYFSAAQTAKVVGKLHHALVDGGYLVVSPSETSHELFRRFATRNHPGVILYQRSEANVEERPGAAVTLQDQYPLPAQLFYEQGSYAQAADTVLASFPAHTPESKDFSMLARALANQGKLAEALVWCDRWIAADKLDAAAHYLRAIVLLEQGNAADARASLQRAVYLDPDFVLAHFALGNVARGQGRHPEAVRHFDNALRLLDRHAPEVLLPESDGVTAARLIETIVALMTLEPVQ